ncbi:hypothetical protein ABB37_03615 [Leptomonas pyrrhocoris]|uniref:Uncharacterized protein n=1 Tax=Leptomonas pyrrhocoris TaxID=157538 RepID=A0A0M9G5B7_LEPPY|nr:hypothetical protein ABB37_03615 [Leptomonas pyrrhocoris]KPA82587.1 hypothetical protein ABB37_03615 [Leptomonas pyrrhocoris]|eukprot:XP_015661026.1 hypothetical protein ABB37_03615 [Leptomonas pyrrhocoris]
MSFNITAHQLVETENSIHFCACSPDAKQVACALDNGSICILNTITFDILARGAPGKDFAGLPATCVRWAPDPSLVEYQLVSSSCTGGVMLWNLDPADESLTRGTSANEEGNEVMTVDVSPSGKFVISAGSDRVVRLYDAALQLLSKLVDGVNADGTRRPTHVNRVFSVRFLTDAVAVSAGWESPLQVWDLRSGFSNRQIVGVQGSSDCLEPVTGTQLVIVASPKMASTLQLIDSVTGRVLKDGSTKACAQLQAEERVVVCRYCEEKGILWCLTVSPPSLIVLTLASGHVFARAPLPAQPLNMSQHGNDVLVACKDGLLLQVSLSM